MPAVYRFGMAEVLLFALSLAGIGVLMALLVTSMRRGGQARPDGGEKYQRFVDEAREHGFAPGPSRQVTSTLALVPATKFHDLVLSGSAEAGERVWLVQARRQRLGDVVANPVVAVLEARGQEWPHLVIRPRKERAKHQRESDSAVPDRIAAWFDIVGPDDIVRQLLSDAMQRLLSDTQRAVAIEFNGPFIAVSTERTGPADLLRILEVLTERVPQPVLDAVHVKGSPPIAPVRFPTPAIGRSIPAPEVVHGYAAPSASPTERTRSFDVTRTEPIGVVATAAALLSGYFSQLDPWARPLLVGAVALLAVVTAVYVIRAGIVITPESVEITRFRRTNVARNQVTSVVDRGPMHGRFLDADGRDKPVRLPHLSASDMWSLRDLLEGHQRSVE